MVAQPLAAAPAFAWEREAGPLPWRVGGISGFTADAATFPDSAGQHLEVYVRLRPATIAALAEGRIWTPRLQLEVELEESGRGGKKQSARQEITFTAADTAAGYGRLVLVPFKVRPGSHRMHVRVETYHRLLPGRGDGKPDVGEIAGEITVPAPQAGRDLSDIEFVWPAGGPQTSGLFRRGDQMLLPNAERLYGLLATAPRAAFTARAPGPARPWRWIARLEDRNGQKIAERDSTGPADEWLHGLVEFDVATLPAGAYVLEVKAWQEGDPGALTRRSTFSVGWERDTWLRDPSDLEDEVHFLLRRDEEDKFERMPPGEQERMIAEYWRTRDPSPETAANELRDVFLQRVHFANQTYGRYGLGKGMFSDMGRVFIRYGEPSEVHRSVIPGREQELASIIERYVRVHDRPIGNVSDPAAGADMRPFEVWIYEGEIMLPFDTDRAVAPRRRLSKPLVFLFIDEQWLGDFRLRYSTE
jgi:GWxTD domain-containing protein